MQIRLTRNEICAADICGLERQLSVSHDIPITDILSLIASSDYLPRISGGRATWIAESGRAIAVMAQQWADPVMIGTDEMAISDLDCRDGIFHLHFRYRAQAKPDAILAELRMSDGRLN